MLSFGSDNHSGVHPEIWKAMAEVNQGHAPSYGTDDLSGDFKKLSQDIFGAEFEPYFVFNGTAANVLCLRSLLKSHEAVICADTAHLHLDECGAPEHNVGVKVLTCPSQDGKISVEQISRFLIRGGDQHYAQPKVISLTQPTEYGTVYSLNELRDIHAFARRKDLLIHIDGARLIYAAHHLDVELKELVAFADAVSFGGTKNGLLFGEVVLLRAPYNEHAKYARKQLMQLPSKSKFLAAQFIRFLKPPGLWRQVARHGHGLAKLLESGLREIPQVEITQRVQANSVFAKFPKTWIKPLKDTAFFYVWDETTFEVRLMLSFDVTEKDVNNFVRHCRELGEK